MLEEKELMDLAGKISTSDLQVIAIKDLGFSNSEVKTLSSANREDQWMLKFDLLNQWKNKNHQNSREVCELRSNTVLTQT